MVIEMLKDQLCADIGLKYVEDPIPEDVYVHDTCADCSRIAEATG
jgi:UDP-glucose 4-epimerase